MASMIKGLFSRFTKRERLIFFGCGGIAALLLILFMLDVLGGLMFALVVLALGAGVGLLFYRVHKRDEVPLPRTSRAPTTPKAPLGKRILRGVGYSFFFFVCFVFFAYMTFPYDRVKDFIIQEVERPMGPGDRRVASGVELAIEELSPSFITGVDLEGVRYTQLGEDPEDPPTIVMIDEASARVSLLSLLTGGLGLTYDLTLGGGTIEGEFDQSDTSQHLAVEIVDVNLLTLGVVRDLIGLPVRGKLSGTVDVTVAQEASESVGSVDLQIAGLKVGDGEAKFPIGGMGGAGITIEEIDAGTLTLKLTVEEGVAEIDEFSTDGPDLELAGEGNIRLEQPLERSRLDLLLRVAFKDAYKEKSDRTRSMFDLLELTPQVRPARTADGALQYRITGSPGGRLANRPAGRETLGD